MHFTFVCCTTHVCHFLNHEPQQAKAFRYYNVNNCLVYANGYDLCKDMISDMVEIVKSEVE